MKGIFRTGAVRRASTAVVAVALLAFVAGCSGQQKTAEAEKEKTETLTAGTTFVASLGSTIDTGKNKVGERITLRTLEPEAEERADGLRGGGNERHQRTSKKVWSRPRSTMSQR